MFHFSLHQQTCGTEEKRTTHPTTGTLLLFDGSCPFATAVLLLMNARGWGNPVSWGDAVWQTLGHSGGTGEKVLVLLQCLLGAEGGTTLRDNGKPCSWDGLVQRARWPGECTMVKNPLDGRENDAAGGTAALDPSREVSGLPALSPACTTEHRPRWQLAKGL